MKSMNNTLTEGIDRWRNRWINMTEEEKKEQERISDEESARYFGTTDKTKWRELHRLGGF